MEKINFKCCWEWAKGQPNPPGPIIYALKVLLKDNT